MTHDTPAVVIGAGINGLGVARSLKRAGVTVYLLDADMGLPAMATRAATPIVIDTLHGVGLVDELVRLGTTRFAGVRPVLLLTQEESVSLVSDGRERLAPLYRFTLPQRELVATLQHKYGFQRLAEQNDCPIPALVRVRAPGEMTAIRRLRYPVVVKPGARSDAYACQFKKAYHVASVAAATELVSRMLPVIPDVVVQEWTEGPDSNIYFCLQYIDARGHTAASFTGHKVRSWPPQVGGTASCAPTPDAHAELSALTTSFFRATGTIGMAAMEYKRDERDGVFRMVEPTVGRTDYQAEIATLNGANLPHAAYCDVLGIAWRAEPATRRLAWRVRSEDLQSALAQEQRITDGFAGCDRVVDALWRASDPGPWLAAGWRRARHAIATRMPSRRVAARPIGSKP